MSQTWQKICINCPAGCHLEITREENGRIIIGGNRCPRGAAYAEQEITDPRRTVTATVSTSDAGIRVPVKSSRPVPLAKIPELLAELRTLRITLPVTAGAVLLRDWQKSGIDILAAHSAGQPE